ncbi:MAG: malate dehydrogenase [bacterium]
MSKVSIVGAGNVGATAALYIAQGEYADVTLVDIVDGMPQGKALDLRQATPLETADCALSGSNDFAALAGSDVVVVTSGFPRKPGMSRDDLLAKNAEIVGSVAANIKKYAPDSIVVMVSNPLDVMAYHAMKVTGFPPSRVVGMAGVLDSARFCTFLAMEIGVSASDVMAMVLGGHGDSMVPLTRYANVAGVPVSELLSKEALDRIVDRTRNGGAEIVALLKAGSAYYAPGKSVARMVEAILKDKKRLVPAAAYLTGQYGLSGIFVGVPVVLGRGGVERIVELSLLPEERAALERSAADVRATIAKLPPA